MLTVSLQKPLNVAHDRLYSLGLKAAKFCLFLWAERLCCLMVKAAYWESIFPGSLQLLPLTCHWKAILVLILQILKQGSEKSLWGG